MLTATVASISERVWRIRIPLPGHSIGHINSYLVVGDSGVVTIDLPWHDEAVLDALEVGIGSTGHNLDDVRGIFISHYHEDHAGAAAWMQARTGAPVFIADVEMSAMRARYLENGHSFEESLQLWLQIVDAPDDARDFAIDQYRSLREYGGLVETPSPMVNTVQIAIAGLEIQAIPTPGHTAGHYSFYESQSSAVFIGDHLFQWGTANANTRPVSAARPVAMHMESSEQLLGLHAELILPGHGEPLDDLASRVDTFARSARKRQSEIVGLCQTPSTVWQLASKATYQRDWRDFSPNSMLSVAGEVHAHLLELESAGSVMRVGDEAALWYATAAESSVDLSLKGSNG